MRLPAETEPQHAIWLTWPGNPATWPGHRRAVERDHARLAAEISRRQHLDLICPDSRWPAAERELRDAGADFRQLTRHAWPVNDAWCRDHGPLFVHTVEGGRAIVDFSYNAWGGKYPSWENDDAVARRVSELRNLPRHRLAIFGEGGALEINSRGVLLTTESVWFNPNRNPGLSRQRAETLFANTLGATETLWLPGGLLEDDTDGHIDTLARFIDDHTVAAPLAESGDPNHSVLDRNAGILRERFDLAPLPHPAPMRSRNGRPLPATYANFLVLNRAVLVPTFAQPVRDARAMDVFRELFPAREIVAIPSETFIQEGGGPHCLAMHEPSPQRGFHPQPKR